MSKLHWKRAAKSEGHYTAAAPEGTYQIASAGNVWQLRTPFGKKHVDSLQEAKRTADRIRLNTLRETTKGHR